MSLILQLADRLFSMKCMARWQGNLLCLFLIFAFTPAHAETDARTHYEQAQKLYETGRYNEAIGEFEKAYALKPHPNVLYNIGQSYERLLNYEKSVTYFEKYLAEAPASAEFRKIVENRLTVLRGLPARISITTIPENVAARLTLQGSAADGSSGRTYSARTPTTFSIPAGNYDIYLDEPGWRPEKHPVTAALGQPYFYQYRLDRLDAPVTILTRPKGARIFVDNRMVGETPFSGTIEAGKHRLLLEHPNYPWYRRDLIVRPNEPERLEIKLQSPERSGRTELVLASMAYGGALGPLLVASIGQDFVRTPAGQGVLAVSSIAGIGSGFLASFLATRKGISVGQSSLVIGSGMAGTFLGTSLALGLTLSPPVTYGISVLGSSLGLTVGALLAHYKPFSAGRVALLNSGVLWGAVGGILLTKSIYSSDRTEQYGWFWLGGTAVGLTVGGFLAWQLALTRAHVALIDLGGLLGMGLGFSFGAAAGYSGNTDIAQQGARFALGGIAVGITLAAVLARGYSRPALPIEALLFKKDSGWALGVPKVSIESRNQFYPETRIMVSVANANW